MRFQTLNCMSCATGKVCIICITTTIRNTPKFLYCSTIRSLYRHVICNVPVSCKSNGDRNHLRAWLDSDLLVE